MAGPWDPSHASAYRPNSRCPSSDSACVVGPCAISAVSGVAPCRLYSPTNAAGCTPLAPCIFDIATDPGETTYLRLADLNDATLTAVATWFFAQRTPFAFDFYTIASNLQYTGGNGYVVQTETNYPWCNNGPCSTAFIESIYNDNPTQTWDRKRSLVHSHVLQRMRTCPISDIH